MTAPSRDVPGQYPGLGRDADQRHAELWPRHKAKARKRHRRRSSLTRGRQSQTD